MAMDELKYPTTEEMYKSALETIQASLAAGRFQEALDFVNARLAADVTLGVQNAVPPELLGFSEDFRAVCAKYRLVAAYVVLDIRQDKATNAASYVMITGGHHVADAAVHYNLRPLKEALGEPVGADKSWLNVVGTDRAVTFTDVNQSLTEAPAETISNDKAH